MRRFIVSILAVVYLFAGGGLLLNQHYCMGEFVDAGLANITESDHQCERCGMTRQAGNSCCDSKVKILKAYDEQVNSKIQDYRFFTFECISPLHFFSSADPARQDIASSLPVLAFQLPPPRDVPIYISNCNWRI